MTEREIQLVVIGGTGFVGRHLLECLKKRTAIDVTYLVHRNLPAWLEDSGVKFLRVDFSDAESVAAALIPQCVVLNLLRPDGMGWFPGAVAAVVSASKSGQVARFIHISSIDVFGAADEPTVTSNTPVRPGTAYEQEHAQGETMVGAAALDLEVVIVRLGAVFGAGGLNVVSLFNEVSRAPRWRLALRRLVYGQRRMHLVSVDKVVNVLVQLLRAHGVISGEVLLLTDDDEPENNFSYVQNRLLAGIDKLPFKAVPHLPPAILATLLKWRGVTNANPTRRISEHRWAELGCTNEADFEKELIKYIDVLRRSR